MAVVPVKSKCVAYLLWLFLGLLGAHKFYLGKIGMGILYIFTFGILGIGLLIDLFTLGNQVDIYNALHGGIGGGNQNQNVNQSQNVVVNLTVPSAAPAAAPVETPPAAPAAAPEAAPAEDPTVA